jgi:hypothetical protein
MINNHKAPPDSKQYFSFFVYHSPSPTFAECETGWQINQFWRGDNLWVKNEIC